MDFVDRKVSNKQTIMLLDKKGIEVNEEDAAVILNFLYLMAKIHKKNALMDRKILKEKSNKSNINSVYD